MTPAIAVQRLYHSYKTHQALCGAMFEVAQGTIHGFVGPNGAGKTTTLKVLATLLKPQNGHVEILGHSLWRGRRQIRRLIGYMPDHFSSYRAMAVAEYLDFFAAAYGMGLAERDRTVDEVLALVDLSARRDDLVQGLSRGMQQRLSLARVLVHDPKLLLLDEPASGLDPRARIELMEILKELCRLGKTVFISSHILSELADLCDAVTILDRGKVKYSGTMQGLLHHQGEVTGYLLRLAEPAPAVAEALRALAGVVSLVEEQEGRALRLALNSAQTSPNLLLQELLRTGGQLVSLAPDARQLNQVFMELTDPGVRA